MQVTSVQISRPSTSLAVVTVAFSVDGKHFGELAKALYPGPLKDRSLKLSSAAGFFATHIEPVLDATCFDRVVIESCGPDGCEVSPILDRGRKDLLLELRFRENSGADSFVHQFVRQWHHSNDLKTERSIGEGGVATLALNDNSISTSTSVAAPYLGGQNPLAIAAPEAAVALRRSWMSER